MSRFALHLTLLVGLLTTSLGANGCRQGGIRIKSWGEAVDFVQGQLEEAGDLEGRLDGYARTAADLSASIDDLDRVRPALDVIAQLRDVQVPLIGDGWQILLALLSLATVDGAKIISRLETILRTLTELKGSLDALSGLPDVAAAVRAFRARPTRRTLSALADAGATATPSLTQLHVDLAEVLEPLKDVAGKLSGLVKALRDVGNADIPTVSDAARRAAEGIDDIEEPMLALRDGLDRLHHDIGADLQVLENIQEAVRQAREHQE